MTPAEPTAQSSRVSVTQKQGGWISMSDCTTWLFSPKSTVGHVSFTPAGMFNPHITSVHPLLIVPLPLLYDLAASWPPAIIFFLFCCLFYPRNKPFLHYFLLYLQYWPFTPLPCQSLCEFYAKHCARIEALRLQLQEEQRGRQVEHTATAGLGSYCSWFIQY